MNVVTYTWPGLWGMGYGAPLNCPTLSYGAPYCLQVANSPSLWLWCFLLPLQVMNSPSFSSNAPSHPCGQQICLPYPLPLACAA
jgi:hypothetical protein